VCLSVSVVLVISLVSVVGPPFPFNIDQSFLTLSVRVAVLTNPYLSESATKFMRQAYLYSTRFSWQL